MRARARPAWRAGQPRKFHLINFFLSSRNLIRSGVLARSACRPAGSACGQIIIHSFLTFSENLFLTVFYSTLRVLAGRLGARPAESAGRLVKCDAPVSAVIGDCDRLITITTTIIIIIIIIVIIMLKKKLTLGCCCTSMFVAASCRSCRNCRRCGCADPHYHSLLLSLILLLLLLLSTHCYCHCHCHCHYCRCCPCAHPGPARR